MLQWHPQAPLCWPGLRKRQTEAALSTIKVIKAAWQADTFGCKHALHTMRAGMVPCAGRSAYVAHYAKLSCALFGVNMAHTGMRLHQQYMQLCVAHPSVRHPKFADRDVA